MSAIISFPSYVIPGTYQENVEFIQKESTVRNVELLFFMYSDDSKISLHSEIPFIFNQYKNFNFTLHMPEKFSACHEEIIMATEKNVSHYIIHPDGDMSLLTNWEKKYGKGRFLLENTTLEEFYKAENECAKYDIECPLCIDVGHLLYQNHDPLEFINKYLPRVKEFHVHGFNGKKDHVLFSKDAKWIKVLAPVMKKFSSIIELELFSFYEVSKAYEILKDEWNVL